MHHGKDNRKVEEDTEVEVNKQQALQTQYKEIQIENTNVGDVELGHFRIGCKVRLDHSKRDLNAKKPMQGEHK